MKTEQLYGEIVAVLNKYETMQNAKALYERGIRGADWCPFHELADLALDLREQMNREAAKSAGRGNARTAMLRIIKNASELRPMVSPITVAAESGDGLILPIRKVENANSEEA